MRFLLTSALLLALFTAPRAQAQGPVQTVLVEHFTNTRCSICASRNPGFFTNLRQQPASTLHVAYYPSSPYSQCLFSQQNPAENDARTNFYGIYGSTPRLVINGAVIPAAQNYAAPALFAPFQNQPAPLTVQTTLTRPHPDSVAVIVQLTTVAPVTGNPVLYVALVEDTVFYASPNGEPRHYNVFRKSFTGPNPAPLTLPAPGSTLTVRRAVAISSLWALPRLYAVAVVQQTGGAQLQAAASAHLNPTVLAVAAPIAPAALHVYPNPVREILRLEALPAAWQVLNVLGQQVAGGNELPETLDVRAWSAGPYVLRVAGRAATRFVVSD